MKPTYEQILRDLTNEPFLLSKLTILSSLKYKMPMFYTDSTVDNLFGFVAEFGLDKREQILDLFVEFCERFNLAPVDINWTDYKYYLKERI